MVAELYLERQPVDEMRHAAQSIILIPRPSIYIHPYAAEMAGECFGSNANSIRESSDCVELGGVLYRQSSSFFLGSRAWRGNGAYFLLCGERSSGVEAAGSGRHTRAQPEVFWSLP